METIREDGVLIPEKRDFMSLSTVSDLELGLHLGWEDGNHVLVDFARSARGMMLDLIHVSGRQRFSLTEEDLEDLRVIIEADYLIGRQFDTLSQNETWPDRDGHYSPQ